MVWCSEFVQGVEVQVTREDYDAIDAAGKISYISVWCGAFEF